jgi:putative ABC transport system permease protein
MINNYFKIAWRNLMKNKVFSFINIFGLTIGLTSFLLIALYILDELTFDAFHKNANNIYRVVENKTTAEGKETKMGAVAYQLAERAGVDFPEIKNAARLAAVGRANVSDIRGVQVFYEDFWIANPGFLTTFDFELLRGDRNTALTAPHSVIVTEETAKKLFGTTDVIGKAIKVDRDSVPCNITAVLKNFRANSHLAFNLCFSEASMASTGFQNYITTDWSSNIFSTYLLLDKETNPRQVDAKINQLVAANQKKDIIGKRSFTLQPLKDIHFYSGGIEGSSGVYGNITYMYVFSIIGCFVLLIACINYMNLTTARFTNRAKEIGVRKVAGALRKNLVAQFLFEAFIIVIIALVLALLLVKIALPWFNSFTGKQLTLGFGTDYRIWVGMVAIIISVGLLSGIYPALFQSRMKPFLLLKSKINIGKGNLSLRRFLVIFQFALSIIMIVATMIIFKQMEYVKTKDLGFNRDQLMVMDINSGKVRMDAQAIKNEFSKLAYVKDVSVSSRVPGDWKDLVKIKVKNEKIQTAEGNNMYFLAADENFLKTYQMELVSGRNFRAGSLADTLSVLINQSAAKELGVKEAVGQMIEIPLNEPLRVKVIGIVKDFNFQSLRQTVAPIVLGFQKNLIQNIDYFTAKVSAGHISETLKQLEAIIHKIDPTHLFEYHFLDKQLELFYREDQIRQTIFLIGAILSILIACLGLFGLATYAAEQRIKEIGIRKVLGASVSNIVSMLSKDFLKLVIISALLAFPVAWWAMNQWLHDFAYRITISWWVFIVAGFAALLIALLTISFQAIKAALANPVKSLRTE